MKCELCNNTGWYGDNGPGIKGNQEYNPCECKDAGYRLAMYGDTATHAICRCGVIAKIDDDNHICSWTKLVKKKHLDGNCTKITTW